MADLGKQKSLKSQSDAITLTISDKKPIKNLQQPRQLRVTPGDRVE